MMCICVSVCSEEFLILLNQNGFSLQLKAFNKPGEGFLKFHFENQYPKLHTRHLVFMTYLNNVDKGGETEFLYQNVKFKPKKGLTLIWPTDWTHTHRGCPCKKTKYIITGWYGFQNIS